MTTAHEQIKALNLYQKLQGARVALQSRNLKKGGENKFANFKYYELPDFLPSINEIFDEVGLFSHFSITGDAQFGTAKLVILNSEKPEETLTFESPIAEAQVKGTTPIQALGSIHTYMKRYLYLNALEIVENDGLDAQVGTDKLVTVDQKKLEKQMKEIKKDDVFNLRKTELETVLFNTEYTLNDVDEWVKGFKAKGNAKTDDLGLMTGEEYAHFKNGILKKLDTERKERIAQGNATPYDHMGTKLK